ncbi:MAG: uroporphyrinogen-III C-methyltransferase [Candidatus Promineifilaceae bacterium]|nr:uroporphyrinogen-III C-methyltransferase [Candidatus Promineifilaceae bacterium]
MLKQGLVYLVGAGPGDPDLITVKGMKCLQQADVVIYDRLANPELLDYAPPTAVHYYVGKAPQKQRFSQQQINALLLDQARQGKVVVRLKGGDPFVFGRGGEECQVLARAGIPFQVVPGITSATSVAAYAGIPVTHRHIAQSFTVITGHTAGAADQTADDWRQLPRDGTLVILMGVGNLPQITERLLTEGYSPQTPAATIYRGTTVEQKVVIGVLENIAWKARELKPPAITIIGEVVKLRQEIDWFNPRAQENEEVLSLVDQFLYEECVLP